MTETTKITQQLEKMALKADSEFSKNGSLYCFLDLKSGLYQKVFEQDCDANAIRVFYDLVGSKSTQGQLLSCYPQDFALVKLADFDYLKGLFNIQSYQIMLGSEARAFNIQRESEANND